MNEKRIYYPFEIARQLVDENPEEAIKKLRTNPVNRTDASMHREMLRHMLAIAIDARDEAIIDVLRQTVSGHDDINFDKILAEVKSGKADLSD